MTLNLNLDRRTLAIASAVASAALVAGAGGLVQVFGAGRLSLSSADLAHILAAAISAAVAAYVQSTRPPSQPLEPKMSGS